MNSNSNCRAGVSLARIVIAMGIRLLVTASGIEIYGRLAPMPGSSGIGSPKANASDSFVTPLWTKGGDLSTWAQFHPLSGLHFTHFGSENQNMMLSANVGEYGSFWMENRKVKFVVPDCIGISKIPAEAALSAWRFIKQSFVSFTSSFGKFTVSTDINKRGYGLPGFAVSGLP